MLRQHFSDLAIAEYRTSLFSACPQHIVIDNLFDEAMLNEVVKVLQQSQRWQTQHHTYSALYVNKNEWHNTPKKDRFVKRDVWQRKTTNEINSDRLNSTIKTVQSQQNTKANKNSALAFLEFLRSDEFMSLLSKLFNVALTDENVANPDINTNYFRLGTTDFVEQHADDSPGREDT